MPKRTPKTADEVPTLDPAELPEVVEFVAADQALGEFIRDFETEYPGILDSMRQLAEERNAALELADKAVRARHVACGPFQVHQKVTKYDAEALFDAVGKERFLALGGSITEKPVYDVDGKRLEAAIAMKKLPLEIVEAVRVEEIHYKRLGKVALP